MCARPGTLWQCIAPAGSTAPPAASIARLRLKFPYSFIRVIRFRQSEFFGFDKHVHQVQEPDDAQDKQHCKHFALNFFEPVDAFEEKPVAERPEGAKQEKKDHRIHSLVGLALNNFLRGRAASGPDLPLGRSSRLYEGGAKTRESGIIHYQTSS